MNTRRIIFCTLAAAACVLVGWLSSLTQGDALQSWYPLLNKPSATPPDFMFGFAWTAIYILSGVALGLVLTSPGATERSRKFLTALFVIQLAANFLWSFFFFGMRNPLLGMIDLLILLALIILFAVKAWPASKGASILFIPYICWVIFAGYLNFYILLNN